MTKPKKPDHIKSFSDQMLNIAEVQARINATNTDRLDAIVKAVGELSHEESTSVTRNRLDEVLLLVKEASAACDEVSLLTRILTSAAGNDRSEALHYMSAAARKLGRSCVKA